MTMRTEGNGQEYVQNRMKGQRVTRTARSSIFNIMTVTVDGLHQDVPGSAQFPFKLSGCGTSYCVKMQSLPVC